MVVEWKLYTKEFLLIQADCLLCVSLVKVSSSTILKNLKFTWIIQTYYIKSVNALYISTEKQQSGGCNMPDQLSIGKMHSVFIIN